MTGMTRIGILMGFSGALESARRELFYPRNPRQILYGSGSSGLGKNAFSGPFSKKLYV